MLCEKCQKREAKIYYTEIVAGKKKEQCLCEECVAELSKFSFKVKSSGKESSIGNLLSGILNGYYNEAAQQQVSKPVLSCPQCRVTYEEILKTGKLGCPACYHAFGKIMSQGLKQMHGSDVHIGKHPKKYRGKGEQVATEMSEIDRLSFALQCAIEKEEFEEAAYLRDEIRRLRKQEEKGAKEVK